MCCFCNLQIAVEVPHTGRIAHHYLEIHERLFEPRRQQGAPFVHSRFGQHQIPIFHIPHIHGFPSTVANRHRVKHARNDVNDCEKVCLR